MLLCPALLKIMNRIAPTVLAAICCHRQTTLNGRQGAQVCMAHGQNKGYVFLHAPCVFHCVVCMWKQIVEPGSQNCAVLALFSIVYKSVFQVECSSSC